MAEKVSAKTAWALAKAIKGAASSSSGSSTQTATFVRKDTDGTCWVRFAGNDFDTPVNGCTLASAEPGQTVQCAIDGTSMSMVGNASDPAVGGKSVSKTVERVRKTLSRSVESAQRVADAAQKVADAVNQHFFADTSGIHVTEATQEDWNTNHSGANVLINALGQLFRDGLNNLLTLTTENGARALSFWDGLGNTAANITAFFGPDTSRIGYDPNSKNCATYFTNSGLQIKSRSYYSPFQLYDVAGIVATDGYVLKKTSLSIDSDWTYTLEPTPPSDTDIKVYSTISTIDRLVGTFTVGTPETISDDTVHGGTYAYDGTATIVHVHDPTHGHNGNNATFGYSMYKDANHPWLHIGYIDSKQLRAGNTISVGTGMLAQSENQAVFGRYNDNDPDNALEVGNGTDDRNRSNAFAVDWDGVVWSADDVPWTVLPLNSDFEAYNSDNVPRYCKRGGVVTVMGAVKPTSELAAQANVDIATLPEGCRPPVPSYTTGHGSNARLWMCTVYANGVVRFGRHANGTSWVSAPTSAFLGFCVTYVAGD